jgi:hypothetical protein
MTTAVASLIVTIALAFLGYGAAHLNDLLAARRRERLDLVTRRLNDFYGPLYVAAKSSEIAFKAFMLKVGATRHSVFDPKAPHDSPVMREWRIWVREVLMPLNNIQETLILKNAHLIREPEVPESLLQFVAHTAAYKAVLAKWQEGDFSEHLSIVDYPTDVVSYAAKSFAELKAEQLALIGRGRGT